MQHRLVRPTRITRGLVGPLVIALASVLNGPVAAHAAGPFTPRTIAASIDANNLPDTSQFQKLAKNLNSNGAQLQKHLADATAAASAADALTSGILSRYNATAQTIVNNI